MFKRKQYYGAGPIMAAQEKAGVLPTQVGSNAKQSLLSFANNVVNALGNPAVLAGQQGIATNINKAPTQEAPAQLPVYQVTAPRPVDRMSAGTTGASALMRMASGVGAHPGYKGSGKGAGGSVGQEVRAARKAKRKAKRTIESGEGGYEGGRVRKAIGGSVSSKLASKILKEFRTGGRSFSKAEKQARKEIDDDIHKLYAKDAPSSEVDQIKEIKYRIQNIDDELAEIGSGGELRYAFESGENPELKQLVDERRILIRELETIEEIGYSNLDFDYREGYQEGGELDAQMSGMMEEPTHTMPDGTEMQGATHGEYEQGLAEGQAEDMAQEGMVPDEQMEEDYVDYIVQSSELASEDINYLEEALAADDRLSMIFDQIVETASEFSGSGPIDGPGSEVSDSIPARLSDGEFVITSKAAEEIGPDNLQGMMEEAEVASDVRQAAATGGIILEEDNADASSFMAQTVDPTEREIQKLQLASNPRSQYRTVYG